MGQSQALTAASRSGLGQHPRAHPHLYDGPPVGLTSRDRDAAVEVSANVAPAQQESCLPSVGAVIPAVADGRRRNDRLAPGVGTIGKPAGRRRSMEVRRAVPHLPRAGVFDALQQCLVTARSHAARHDQQPKSSLRRSPGQGPVTRGAAPNLGELRSQVTALALVPGAPRLSALCRHDSRSAYQLTCSASSIRTAPRSRRSVGASRPRRLGNVRLVRSSSTSSVTR